MSRYKVKFPNGYTKYCYAISMCHALEKAIFDPKGGVVREGQHRLEVDDKLVFDQEKDRVGIKTDKGIVWCARDTGGAR